MAPGSTIEQWLEACRRTDRGVLFLDNLAVDRSRDSLTPADVAALMKALDDATAILGKSSAGKDRYVEVFEKAMNDGALCLRGPVNRAHRSLELMCVFRFDEALSDIWFDLSVIGGAGDFPTAESILAKLTRLPDLAPVLRRGAAMRGGLPMVWLTKKQQVEEVVSGLDPKRAADELRNALGLLHHTQDFFLCGISVSAADLAASLPRKPTALDGGLNLVFRSNDAKEKYGLTIDLMTHAPRMIEYVGSPIALAPVHKIVPYGRVSGLSSFSWRDLAQTVRPDRVDVVAEEMKAAL